MFQIKRGPCGWGVDGTLFIEFRLGAVKVSILSSALAREMQRLRFRLASAAEALSLAHGQNEILREELIERDEMIRRQAARIEQYELELNEARP